MTPREDPVTVTFNVSCGHEACAFSTRVELDADPGPWQPTSVSDVLDGNGDPIMVQWAGQPLLDAYNQHYVQVHAPQGQPPMCEWTIVA
jgi:hypothetical protein